MKAVLGISLGRSVADRSNLRRRRRVWTRRCFVRVWSRPVWCRIARHLARFRDRRESQVKMGFEEVPRAD